MGAAPRLSEDRQGNARESKPFQLPGNLGRPQNGRLLRIRLKLCST